MRLSKKIIRRIKVTWKEIFTRGGDTMPRPGAKFVVKQTVTDSEKYVFTLIAPNGQVVCVSETYNTMEACLNGIKAVKKYSKTRKIEKPSVK